MLMDIWSDFNKSSSQEWEEKVLFDFKDKIIENFYWKTEYGKINPFLIDNESIFDEKSQNFNDIRGVCTIKINEVIYENKIKEKKIIILYLEQLLKTLFWKLRFLSRLFKK